MLSWNAADIWLVLCIREVPGSNLGQQTYYLTDDFCGLSQSIQANSAIISQSEPGDEVFWLSFLAAFLIPCRQIPR
jgi:hypothetical protein